VPAPIACVAASLREARKAAHALRRLDPAAEFVGYSLRGYLALPDATSRIVLCAAAAPPRRALAFLATAVPRLLWPAAGGGLRGAIDGLRDHHGHPPDREAPARGAAPRRPGRGLLMEALVGPERIRAALLSAGPSDWIVESARHVRAPRAWLETAAGAGIRWSVLDPIELLGVYVSAGLWKTRGRWTRLLPRKTPVWVEGRGAAAEPVTVATASPR
jgi:hypothetical protein